MSKLSHTDLIKLSTLLGYSSAKGLCRGFTGMLMQAMLAEGDEEKHFFERLAFIETYNNNFSKLTEDIKKAKDIAKNPKTNLDSKTTQLLDINAFFDGIEAYLNPRLHSDIFDQDYVNQSDLETIYPLIRSIKLEQDNTDISILYDKTYAFNKDSLISYLKDLAIILKESSSTHPVSIQNSGHDICLRYNKLNDTWIYVDTNDFKRFSKNPSYTRELSHTELANSIFTSFSTKNVAVFNTTILSKSNIDHSILKNSLKDFDLNYPVKQEHGDMFDDEGTGMLHLICRYHYLTMLKKLLQLENIDLNKSTSTGFFPLYIVCSSGNLDLVKELLLNKSIDVNKCNDSGFSSLASACNNGSLQIVKELLIQESINVNLASLSGTTPLYIACHFGRLDLVKELLKHKSIDVNPSTLSGLTPLSLACKEGHLEIVKELLKQESINVHLYRSGLNDDEKNKLNNHPEIIQEINKYINKPIKDRGNELMEIVNEYLRSREHENLNYQWGFFEPLQYSFADKKAAILALSYALDDKKTDLASHLGALRDGNLGQKLRTFIKSGRADLLVGYEVTTVSDLVIGLDQKVNPKNSETSLLYRK